MIMKTIKQRLNIQVADEILTSEFDYGLATVGFIARFGKLVELDMNLISQFDKSVDNVLLSGELCLVFRFGFGKW